MGECQSALRLSHAPRSQDGERATTRQDRVDVTQLGFAPDQGVQPSR